MREDIRLFDSQGLKCERLLERLDTEYKSLEEAEKQKAIDALLAMKRSPQGLSKTLNDVEKLRLECSARGHVISDDLMMGIINRLLTADESVSATMFAKDAHGTVTLERKLKVLREVAGLREAAGSDAAGSRKEHSEFSGLSQNNGFKKHGKSSGTGQGRRAGVGPGDRDIEPGEKKSMDKCGRCGRNKHRDGASCPAANETCRKCQKKGHFERVCKASASAANATEDKQAGGVTGETKKGKAAWAGF
jgi:hypothetical protein